jgi:hypothetical protein
VEQYLTRVGVHHKILLAALFSNQLLMIFQGKNYESASSEWGEALPAQFGATEYLRIGSCEAFGQIPFSQGNAKMWRHA